MQNRVKMLNHILLICIYAIFHLLVSGHVLNSIYIPCLRQIHARSLMMIAALDHAPRIHDATPATGVSTQAQQVTVSGGD